MLTCAHVEPAANHRHAGDLGRPKSCSPRPWTVESMEPSQRVSWLHPQGVKPAAGPRLRGGSPTPRTSAPSAAAVPDLFFLSSASSPVWGEAGSPRLSVQ